MAEEQVFRIEIPVIVSDHVNPGLQEAERQVNDFESRHNRSRDGTTIPVTVVDQTGPGVSSTDRSLTAFDRRIQRSRQQIDVMNATRLQLTVYALDRASSVFSTITSKARSLASKTVSVTIKAVDLVTGPFRAIGNMLASPLGMLGAGAGIAGLVAAPLKAAGDMEQAQIAFTTMLGSAEKANDFLRQLQNFAAATPFEFPQLQSASKMLLAFQFQAQDIIPMMTSIGNASSGLGVGADGIQRIILALGQMKAAGKVGAQDMMQLTSVGINGWKILGDAMGKSQAEVRQLSEKGLLPADQAIKLLVAGMNKQFPNMMEKQSHSLMGLLSTIKDTFNMNIFTAWGQGIAQAVEPRLQKLVDWFGKNDAVVQQWRQTLTKAGQTIAETVLSNVERLQKALSDLAGTDAWQKADAFGRIKLAWDKIVVEPFDKWWSSGGGTWMNSTAAKIGGGLGGAIGGFLSQALGLATPDDTTSTHTVNPVTGAMEDKQKVSPFITAGSQAGKAFFDAFAAQFNGEEIAKKAWDAFKGVAGKSSIPQAVTGGSPTSGSAILSDIFMVAVTAAALKKGRGAYQGIKGIASGVRGTSRFVGGIGRRSLNWFRGTSPAAEAVAPATEAAAAAAVAPGVSSSLITPTATTAAQNSVPILGPNGEILSTVSRGEPAVAARAAEAVHAAEPALASVARAGGEGLIQSGLRAGGRTLGKVAVPLAVAADMYNIATAQGGEEKGKAIGGAAGGWGGAAAGAAIGTLILPGVGTVIGGLLGGFIGSMGGEAIGGKIGKSATGDPTKASDEVMRTAGTTYDAQKGFAKDTYSSQMDLAKQVYDAQDKYAKATYDAQQAMYQATKDTNAAPMMLVSIADAALTAIGSMFSQALLQNAIDTGQVGHWESASEGDAGASMAPRWVAPKAAGTSSGPQVSVTVNYNPNYNITAKADAEDVLQIVKDNHKQIADDVSDEVAKEIEKTFNNTGYQQDNWAFGF